MPNHLKKFNAVLPPAQVNMRHRLELLGVVYHDTLKHQEIEIMEALERKGFAEKTMDPNGDPCWRLIKAAA